MNGYNQIDMGNSGYGFRVCVRCYTFNHASYIVDALDGFVIQKTLFPFVCAIVDDASTDGEPDVIKDYLSKHFVISDDSMVYNEETDDYVLTFARHKTNLNCWFLVLLLKENHRRQGKGKMQYLRRWVKDSEYIAFCEGDDYWTDSQKLQKQVDFLDAHKDYSLCCHRFKIFNEDTGEWRDDFVSDAFSKHPGVLGLEVTNSENFKTRFTWTLTLCYRKSMYDRISFPHYKGGRRDFHLHYHLLNVGRGYCFSDYMGVYRKHSEGVWSCHTALEQARIRLEGYKDLYHYNKEDRVVLERYCEWLELFYDKFVLSPFQRHKITKNGLKNLLFTVQHDFGTKGVSHAFRHIWGCFVALLRKK